MTVSTVTTRFIEMTLHNEEIKDFVKGLSEPSFRTLCSDLSQEQIVYQRKFTPETPLAVFERKAILALLVLYGEHRN